MPEITVLPKGSIKTYEALSLDERKNAFIEWMKTTPKPHSEDNYQQSIVDGYSRALEKDPLKVGPQYQSLYNYTSIDAFVAVEQRLRADNNFAEINKKDLSGGFSAAMNRYKEFLLYLNGDSNQESNDKGDSVSISNEVMRNTVLYGPPGTGKTYNSVIYAVAICEGKEVREVQKESYPDVLDRYNALKSSADG